MWGTTFDRTARTAAARAGWLEKLADRADPDRLLPQAERTKRAQSLRKAHLQSIALKSAKARRLRAEQKKRFRETRSQVIVYPGEFPPGTP